MTKIQKDHIKKGEPQICLGLIIGIFCNLVLGIWDF